MNNKVSVDVTVPAPATDQAVGGLITKLLGPAAGELGNILGNELVYWKMRHSLWLKDRVSDALRARGVDDGSQHLTLATGMRVIEQACYVTDETLRDRWARLIANALDPNRRTEIRQAFLDILGKMEPLDAQILEMIAAHPEAETEGVRTGWLPEKVMDSEKKKKGVVDLMEDEEREPDAQIGASLTALISFGCLFPTAGFGGPIYLGLVRLTPFGRQLVEACEP